MSHAITVIPGDGIGPEVIAVTLDLIKAAGVNLDIEECRAGEKVFAEGSATGVPQDTIDSIARTAATIKGPLATPVGFGGKSANVTLRKLFETYANIRPAKEIPGVNTPFAGRGIDLVVVRENVEDLYAGIEHMQTQTVAQTLKLISRLGCEKIVRTAFEYARSEKRKTVHCATKANIMKLAEGMLKRTFEDIAPEYPEINAEHIIIDNLAHLLVIKPEEFDVIVSTNMNGDIISDLTSGLIGGLGFAPSANIGDSAAIFEAVHGSAPDIAGKDIANPTAVVLAGTMMLRFLNELDAAKSIENALLYVLEAGEVCTGDVRREGAKVVGTKEFGEAVKAALGKVPRKGAVTSLAPFTVPRVDASKVNTSKKTLMDRGLDLFTQGDISPVELGKSLEECAEGTGLRLKMISNRGTRVYPPTGTPTDCIDHWRCRFLVIEDGAPLTSEMIASLLQAVEKKYRWMQIEKLPVIDGELGYSMAQGEE